MKAVGLIPVRLESSRLPNKALLQIDGLPMFVHTMKRAMLSNLYKVYVCTDSVEVAQEADRHGGNVIMTSSGHLNGTTRINEAACILDDREECYHQYIDIQGDEPLVDPWLISTVADRHHENLMSDSPADILLPTLPMMDGEPGVMSQNVVKVVRGYRNRVLYMSRLPIPLPFRGCPAYQKHLSIISFTRQALQRFSNSEPTPLELTEGVELLRALEIGMSIVTTELYGDSFSVDVLEDYESAKVAMESDKWRHQYRNV